MLCILCIAYCVLCTVWCIQFAVSSIRFIVYCVMNTVQCILSTVYCVLYTVYCVLCNLYCVLYPVYCILCTAYGIFYIVLYMGGIFCNVYNNCCILRERESRERAESSDGEREEREFSDVRRKLGARSTQGRRKTCLALGVKIDRCEAYCRFSFRVVPQFCVFFTWQAVYCTLYTFVQAFCLKLCNPIKA